MSRSMELLALNLIASILLNVPVVGQRNKTTTPLAEKGVSVLRQIYDEDQKDRTDQAGDARRRDQVRRLISKGKVQSGADYYYAAFIFQHGQEPSDYLYAHVLAVTAVSKGFHLAIWLCAASLDRYLHAIKQPQIFGTQYGSLYDSSDDQGSYDKEMVSDALREQWCVAPYSTQVQILSDVRAGRGFRSTRICPVP